MPKDTPTTKITLETPESSNSSAKISLGSIGVGSGINKEDILKKFMKQSSSGKQVVHKNFEQNVVVEEKKVQEQQYSPYDSPYSSPYASITEEQTQRPERTIENRSNSAATKPSSTTLFKEKPVKAKPELHITLPAKVEIKAKKIEKEEHTELPHDFSIFGTKPEGQAPSITIDTSKEDEVQKEDHRDKSIIEKHLQHYKYLEFDKESEIDNLKTGENLREFLSKQRQLTEEDDVEIISTFVSEERNRKRKKSSSFGVKRKNTNISVQEQAIKTIEIPELISMQELANRLSLKINLVIEKAKFIGEHANEDSILDGDIAELIVEEFRQKVLRVKEKTPEDILNRKAANTDIKKVPPVVTVMGHVDHGKTSLLDALRHTDIALGEAGGITQHIGAYQVTLPSGQKITFIDTPGHEAFTAMRARGANATDIAILVVAADDSINTQTIEAIHHAKAANCPIIVAVNKMDLHSANLQKVKEDLLSHHLVPEDFGGDIAVMPVSALKRTGLKELEERILLQADVMDLKANHLGHAGGIVLESKLDNKKGVVVTVLIKHGILKNGDIILAGTTHGRVRKMVDDKGQTLAESLPSMPVEIYGFSEVPTSGERFFVMESERLAREVISHRIERIREENTQNQISISTDSDPFAALLKKEKKEIGIIIRSDAQGTLDAIRYSLEKIQHEEIKLHIIQSMVGNVTEADILLAKTKGATIFAFNVSVGSNEENIARKASIVIRQHSVIYKIIDEIKALLSDSLSPVQIDTKVGSASVRQVFDVSKAGKIAGLHVTDGVVKRNALAKVVRNGEIIAQGNIRTLKHFQEDAKTIQQGKECGLQMEKFEGFIIGDIIDVYDVTFEKGKID